MSNETREKALAAASSVFYGTGQGAEAVAAAEAFLTFLSGPQPAPSSAATSSLKKPGRPRKTEEEVANAAIADAAGSAEEAADAVDAAEDDEPVDPKKAVQDAIASALAKNKRKEVIALLKKFGAASATGVKAKDAQKFIAEVAKIIGKDAESEDDLTA